MCHLHVRITGAIGVIRDGEESRVPALCGILQRDRRGEKNFIQSDCAGLSTANRCSKNASTRASMSRPLDAS